MIREQSAIATADAGPRKLEEAKASS
jgi:hypothetical protein